MALASSAAVIGGGGVMVAGAGIAVTGNAISATARNATVVIPATALLTSTSPQDLVSVALPANITRWVPVRIIVQSTAASGTLALATIDLRSALAGGGASLLAAATALTTLSAANIAVSLTGATLGAVFTSSTITLRQTVDSGNAGTISLVIELIDLT